jgi:glucose/arabinose dehydrogenase
LGVIARRQLVTLVTSCAVALSACDSDPTAPAAGRLGITFDDLPMGVAAAVVVSGPNAFTRSVTASDTLEGLVAGRYTITASDVTAGGARFRANPATQTIDVPVNGLGSADRIGYRLASARLTVRVVGLPTGANGALTLTGPNGFSRALTLTTTLELLEPGTYSIASADVQASGKTFHPSPSIQTIPLAASTTTQLASVWYGGGSGSLQVEVKGLPDGVAAVVDITGPDGFARTISGSATIPYLENGAYTVSGRPVGSDLTTYRTEFGSQLVQVAGGPASAFPITYVGAPLALGLTLVVSGLTSPVFLTAPEPDSRLFIVERTGRVRVVKDGALLPTPFLDIANKVNFAGERGLLGMAFDPSYATNGRFYVYYVDLSGNVTLERFGSTPGSDIAGPSLGSVITIPHGGSEHHGGMVAFGPDGMLYFAPGDGGCCGDPNDNAQNLGTLLGKMLRLDVRVTPYAVPAGNPFIDRVGQRPEIWAYGLRNPWRFSFDPLGGLLYIGDVGQDAREEIDVSPVGAAGRNYGWRRMEGNACYNPSSNCDPGNAITKPVLEYLHNEGCSVTAGYVYRGMAIPELASHYLYSDYCRGWVRSFRLVGGAVTAKRDWGLVVLNAVSFGQDGLGELFIIGGNKVWQIIRL